MSIIRELKRRNVFKVGIAYAVTTWVLLQFVDTMTGILSLPEWAPKLILLMLVVGFVPALILAWAFELTPEGIKLEKDVDRQQSVTPKTGRKLDYLIIVSLGLSLGYFIWESRYEQSTAVLETASRVPQQQLTQSETPPATPVSSSEIDANSIAVLPFANRSADDGDIYFTDGIHDDLLTQLSKIDAFSVISRTSVMEYRDTTKNLQQIARELSVANVMEGSVQRAGDRVRINVQLIDAKTDEHMWAEIYDRELSTENLFDIQSEIAKAIAEALEATLTDSELASVNNVPTNNIAAYELYLQARRFAYVETAAGYKAAIDLYLESLKLDPGFKLAWTGLVRAHMTNYFIAGGDPADRDLALDAIERARAIDPDFAELYMAEGIYWYWGHLDYERALYKLDKSIDMMPGNAEAYMWRGWVSRRAGWWEQAVESMQHSLKLNPRVHLNWQEYALTLLYLHRYDEALVAVKTARELDMLSFWGKIGHAKIAIQMNGDIDTAIQATTGAQHGDDLDFFETYMLVRLLARRYEEALESARNVSDELEIQRSIILLREVLAAEVLHYMGRGEEAVQAANAGLFRLQGIRASLGEDPRIDMAEAMVNAIQGAPAEKISSLTERSIAAASNDQVASFEIRTRAARIYAIAGMIQEAVEALDTVLIPPGDISVSMIDLDPAFDAVRDHPAFVAVLEKYR